MGWSRFLATLPLVATALGCGGDSTGPAPDDPALIGRWASYARSSDPSGMPGCWWAYSVLRIRSDQTLVDSTYTLDESDAHRADSLAVCRGTPVGATQRTWAVPEPGRVVLTPGYSLAADTLDYHVVGDSLTLGAAVFVKSP